MAREPGGDTNRRDHAGRIRDYLGTYEEYVAACGDDHLDVESVVLKAQKEKKEAKREAPAPPKPKPTRPADPAGRLRTLEKKRGELTARIEAAEARVVEIDDLFCREGYFDSTAPDEVAARQRERADLTAEVSRLVAEWEGLEDEIGELSA
jgi:hypothetical protein